MAARKQTLAKKKTTKAPADRAPGGRFVKGQSGNPSGRPKEIGWVRDLARAETAASIRALVRVRDDKKAPYASVVAASQALLDRGWGKPSQPVGGADDLPPLQGVTRIEVVAVAAVPPSEPDA